MKEISIIISKRDVFEEVGLQTSYAGLKNDNNSGFYQRVAALKQDEALLNRFWSIVCGKVADYLQGLVREYSDSADSFSLQLEVSGAYDDVMTPSVRSDLFNAMWSGVGAAWFDLTYPEKGEEWHLKEEQFLKSMLSKLSQRRKPMRSISFMTTNENEKI